MYKFSDASMANYATLHFDLQRICDEAIKIVDFAIIVGHRGKSAQDNAFAAKTSKLKWPDSKHNLVPSHAMDLTPTPIDWEDRERFIYLAGVVMAVAAQLGIKLRYGGDWNGNGKFSDEKFSDLPHFELA